MSDIFGNQIGETNLEEVQTSIIPIQDGTENIGSETKRIDTIHAINMEVSNLEVQDINTVDKVILMGLDQNTDDNRILQMQYSNDLLNPLYAGIAKDTSDDFLLYKDSTVQADENSDLSVLTKANLKMNNANVVNVQASGSIATGTMGMQNSTVTFNGTSGINIIDVPDEQADALSLTAGGQDYMVIDSVTGQEKVILVQDTQVSGELRSNEICNVTGQTLAIGTAGCTNQPNDINIGTTDKNTNIKGGLYAEEGISVTGDISGTAGEVSFSDPIINIHTGNTGNIDCSGIAIQYKDGPTQWAGLVRDPDTQSNCFTFWDEYSANDPPPPNSDFSALKHASICVKEVHLQDEDSGAYQEIEIKAPADVTATYGIILPADAPTANGQSLSVTDFATGATEWASASGGSVPALSGNKNKILTVADDELSTEWKEEINFDIKQPPPEGLLAQLDFTDTRWTSRSNFRGLVSNENYLFASIGKTSADANSPFIDIAVISKDGSEIVNWWTPPADPTGVFRDAPTTAGPIAQGAELSISGKYLIIQYDARRYFDDTSQLGRIHVLAEINGSEVTYRSVNDRSKNTVYTDRGRSNGAIIYGNTAYHTYGSAKNTTSNNQDIAVYRIDKDFNWVFLKEIDISEDVPSGDLYATNTANALGVDYIFDKTYIRNRPGNSNNPFVELCWDFYDLTDPENMQYITTINWKNHLDASGTRPAGTDPIPNLEVVPTFPPVVQNNVIYEFRSQRSGSVAGNQGTALNHSIGLKFSYENVLSGFDTSKVQVWDSRNLIGPDVDFFPDVRIGNTSFNIAGGYVFLISLPRTGNPNINDAKQFIVCSTDFSDLNVKMYNSYSSIAGGGTQIGLRLLGCSAYTFNRTTAQLYRYPFFEEISTPCVNSPFIQGNLIDGDSLTSNLVKCTNLQSTAIDSNIVTTTSIDVLDTCNIDKLEYGVTNKFDITCNPTSDFSWVLPNAQGGSGQVLTNDSSGNLSWTTPAPPGTGDIVNSGQTGVISVGSTDSNMSLLANGNTFQMPTTQGTQDQVLTKGTGNTMTWENPVTLPTEDFDGDLTLATVLTFGGQNMRAIKYIEYLDVLITSQFDVNNNIACSSDGATWVGTPSPVTTNPVTEFATNNVNVVVGITNFTGASASNRIIYSSDCLTWTIANLPVSISVSLNGIAYSEKYDRFLVVGQNAFFTSTDGINWTQRTPASAVPVHIQCEWVSWYGDNGSFFAPSFDGQMGISSDGIDWIQTPILNTVGATKLTISDELGIKIFTSGASVYSSTTGTIFNDITSSFTPAPVDLRYGVYAKGRFFLMEGSSTQSGYYTSSDGINWTFIPDALSQEKNVIAYLPRQDKFYFGLTNDPSSKPLIVAEPTNEQRFTQLLAEENDPRFNSIRLRPNDAHTLKSPKLGQMIFNKNVNSIEVCDGTGDLKPVSTSFAYKTTVNQKGAIAPANGDIISLTSESDLASAVEHGYISISDNGFVVLKTGVWKIWYSINADSNNNDWYFNIYFDGVIQTGGESRHHDGNITNGQYTCSSSLISGATEGTEVSLRVITNGGGNLYNWSMYMQQLA